MDTGALFLGIAIGGIVGGALAWALQRAANASASSRLEAEKARLAEELRGERDAAAAKLQVLAEAETRFRDAFKSLAADALGSNNRAFIDLARQTLNAVLAEAQGHLGKRGEEIATLVKPLKDSLTTYEEHLRGLEEKRERAFGGIEEQLRSVSSTHQQLQRETSNLVNALRRPEVRGRWGEMTLRNIVELAGMSERCDFESQAAVAAEGSTARPDMVIRLPGGRTVVVDAKAPLDAYLDSIQSDDEAKRAAHLDNHVTQVRTQLKNLASKGYQKHFENTPDFVVMFMPESPFIAAVARDRTLLEYGMKEHVILATPSTLIALLWTVRFGWQQEDLAANAREISQLGKDLYSRLITLAQHLQAIGGGLARAVASYNEAVGSLESRVLSAARKFREHGIDDAGEIEHVVPVESHLRAVQARELEGPPAEASKSPTRQ
ncbi:MAG: DNA recombination protein RmuC [Planctomycetes bacterium]|nr:DNA recombination protein RmuC [Planctomycetota bacterium]